MVLLGESVLKVSVLLSKSMPPLSRASLAGHGFSTMQVLPFLFVIFKNVSAPLFCSEEARKTPLTRNLLKFASLFLCQFPKARNTPPCVERNIPLIARGMALQFSGRERWAAIISIRKVND